MIDNEKEAHELIESLNQHMPMRGYATPPLVRALREKCSDLKVNDAVKIDSVVYLGDEGGVACTIKLKGSKTVVVASITHLRIDSNHPLAKKIQMYQLGRTQDLEAPVNPNKATNKNEFKQRFQTACTLWECGEYQQSAHVFREVHVQEHGEPYFSRYWLASCLFQLRSFDKLDKLLQKLDDHSGIWRFAQALEAFRRHGDTESSQRLLVEAHRLEPEFERYLLQDKMVESLRPVRFDAGLSERAFGCARLFLPAWRAVPGAATWARRVLKTPPASEQEDLLRRFPRDELRALPMRREIWQVGLMSDSKISSSEPHNKQIPMWLLAVANVDGHEMRVMTVIDQPLTETIVWNHMIESLLSPMEGDAARPSTLVVGQREFCDAWKPLLEEIGTCCLYEKDPQPVGQFLEAMGAILEKDKLPPQENLGIREFPQSNAVWQADFVRSPAWIVNEQEGAYRPWSVLVLDKTSNTALTTAHTPSAPTPEMMLDFLVRTMAKASDKSRQRTRRPRLVEVSDSDCYDHLKPRLEAAGIACQLVDEMLEFNDFCLRLAKSFDGSEKCALADGKRITHAHMESFYEAAEYFFKKAPWRRVSGEIPIEIRCDQPAMGTRYGIVMGRTGVQLGLCIYDDWEITQTTLCGLATPDENRALVVCYDEEQIMAAVDLLLIDRLGWPIATPEAWPAVMRLKPHRMPSSANAEELEFLDACLRAIPDFIQANRTSHTQQVETGTRPVVLHLSLNHRHA